jgi:hypothetical protein
VSFFFAAPAKPGLWSQITSTVKKVVAPVVNALQPKKNVGGGGKPMLALAKQEGDPPPPEEKDCGILWLKCVGEWIGNNVKSWFEPKTPVSTPDIIAIQTAAVQSVLTQIAPTATPTFTPTTTPTNTPTPTPVPASSAVVFCGSLGSARMKEKGPECTDPFLAAWNPNKFGFPVYPSWGGNLIQYTGYKDDQKNGKYMQFRNAQSNNIILGNAPIIIGYSVGAEPALMYTRDVIRQGGTVKSVVLLDPTFTGIDDGLGHDTNFNDWKAYMDEIIVSGTSILVIDDNGTDPNHIYINEDAKNYIKPDEAKGHYLYEYRPYLHASDPLPWITPEATTNLSSELAAWAYSWAQNPYGQQP